MLGYILTYFSLGNGETLIVLDSQQRDISLPTSTVRHFWTSAEKKTVCFQTSPEHFKQCAQSRKPLIFVYEKIRL